MGPAPCLSSSTSGSVVTVVAIAAPCSAGFPAGDSNRKVGATKAMPVTSDPLEPLLQWQRLKRRSAR
jgi:hypothetical protein